MRARRGRLRSGLTALAAAMSLLLVAVNPASAQDDNIVPPGDWSDAQSNWMINWIDQNEQVLPADYPATFNDGGDQLEDMGFYNFGVTAPGGYDHWIHPGRINDGHLLNPNHVESLVYRHTGGGNWVLEAGMYFFNDDVTHDQLPLLVSWIPGWHGHPELCRNPDGTFAGITDPDNPNCPPGTENAATPVMVHAWLVDPGCGHRFGGVGVGGLHCDVSHHD